jgi:nicotinate phosphoribosyltransferase
MGHSYIQSFDNEAQAFRSFLRVFPGAILLIDTYDVLRATQVVIDLAREMGPEFHPSGVRLDSGDLTPQAHQVRRMLDEAGLTGVKIFASNSLDEYEIERLVTSGVPIDGFGVGAHMAISSDAPVIDAVYKLAEYAGRPRMKLSATKSTLPGRKQIFREKVDGAAKRDVIGLAHESLGGDRLLLKVMENGVRVRPREPLDAARTRCQAQLRTLAKELLSLSTAHKPYSIELSPGLAGLRDEIARSS